MHTQNVFEIFNHFLESKDATQILGLADNVEVFGSTTFGDGKTHIGSTAPDKMRETIGILQHSKSKISIEVKQAFIEDNIATFFLNVLKGKKKSSSVLNIVVSNEKLRCFQETTTKT